MQKGAVFTAPFTIIPRLHNRLYRTCFLWYIVSNGRILFVDREKDRTNAGLLGMVIKDALNRLPTAKMFPMLTYFLTSLFYDDKKYASIILLDLGLYFSLVFVGF